MTQDASAAPQGAAAPVALVTAGASGVGRAIAKAYYDAGWAVHVCDVDERALTDFLEAYPGSGARCADVSDPAAAERVVKEILASYGRLDTLVNNAGIAGPTGPVEDLDADSFRQCLDVNLVGAFNFIKHAARAMKEAGSGSIINIASNAALFGFPYRTPYAASKWALIGLTKTLAMELGPYGIRVNAICPGSVEGPRIEGVIVREAASLGVSPDEVRRTYEGQSSMQTFIRAEDVANMCTFLSSKGGERISGQSIAVDGHTESLSFPVK
ncbi:SDR family oxidoreductase [Oceanicaulis sp.]|uniref:SDR family oxidoreductase n=1 Tax=Oceanicaulis sp. TaxID=1924941 RepID=UPI003BAAC193